MASVTFSGLDPFRLRGITLTKNELGTGSYATVYELDYFGLKCAGKKIHDLLIKQQAGGDTYQLSRFAEECRLLSQVRHPNVVQFLGVHFEQRMQVPILVMEFLPINLTSCIEKDGVLPPELGYSILHDVALGLNYLHSQDPPIIHRDLSSNNVLLTSDMKAKISDLGVAKIVNLTPFQVSRMVHNTRAPGTPAYMPPEAMVARPKYDRSIDIFSFGVMIIHMFSGRWPEPQESQIRMDPFSDRMIPVSEAERREVFLKAIGDKHPMMNLIRQCINNNPKRRPNINDIVPQLKGMVVKNPPLYLNRLEMLQQIDTERELRESQIKEFQSRIEMLQLELKAERQSNTQQSLSHQPNPSLSVVTASPDSSMMPNPNPDAHRHIGMQRKSSSITEGDRIGQSYYREGQGRERYRADGRHLDVIPGLAGTQQPQQQQHRLPYREDQIQEEHENIHNQMQYGQSGYGLWPSEQQPAAIQPQYATSLAEVAIAPSSNVMPNPNLGVGSRIQIATSIPNEPFKYGVIRWIGEVLQIQGPVAGIELVSNHSRHSVQLYIFISLS